jgi:hypothetical protein
MSTLSIRAPHALYGWWLSSFARTLSFGEAVLDVLADADRQASAATCALSRRRLVGQESGIPSEPAGSIARPRPAESRLRSTRRA